MSASRPFAVVLVEDNRDDATLVLHELEKEGMVGGVRWVEDGRAALDVLLGAGAEAVRESVKLVLLDIKLPHLDGIEVLRLIKEHPGARRIPVVMLSASDAARDIETCYDLGANGYIYKPPDFIGYMSSVVGAVRYWTRHNVSVTESGRVRWPPGA